MIRSVAFVVAALVSTRPHVSETRARAYAEVTVEEGRKRNFDPITPLAMADLETGGSWRATLVGGAEHKCHGLGQICVQYVYAYCRGDGYESDRCRARRSELLDGAANLRMVAKLITLNRKFCRRKTGRPALFARWLSSYQGFNDTRNRPGVWCNMRRMRGRWVDVGSPDLTRRVIQRRLEMIRAGQRALRRTSRRARDARK